ncbi:Mitochondrial GTPase 1 [Ophidiomyces ophidiicola]|nr:Mitochondrial GTPase 1 [Ophidiomyces ophidiicola]KAI1964114.1 Mitochondrial GTPase 1 [Ophidiomyces ophidiicola]
MSASFVPRQVFNVAENIPRSYFLGHHRAGLMKMKSMLDTVDHVIECRDFRLPFTSINPLFEHVLGSKPRTIVYTKRDLAGDRKLPMQKIENQVLRWDRRTSKVFIIEKFARDSLKEFIKYFRALPLPEDNLTGYNILMVGMPNVGKSSFINHLRTKYLEPRPAPKAAITGGQPGVTRKISTPIKILERKQCPIYVLDTPGVFVPYIHDAETMIKLAACGIIKDSLVSHITIADYLLYHINKVKPYAYRRYHEPTNDIMELLECFARQTGSFQKGGLPNIDAAARKFHVYWLQGKFPRFVLDDVLSISTTQRLEWQSRFKDMFSDEQKLEEKGPTSTIELGL